MNSKIPAGGWNATSGGVSARSNAMPRQAYTACPDIPLVDDVKAIGAMDTDVELGKGEGCETIPGCSGYSSMVHSKKVIKHALRQQAKRRRKNTTIAAGNSRTLPRIVVKPLPPPPNDPPSPVNNVQHVNTGNLVALRRSISTLFFRSYRSQWDDFSSVTARCNIYFKQ